MSRYSRTTSSKEWCLYQSMHCMRFQGCVAAGLGVQTASRCLRLHSLRLLCRRQWSTGRRPGLTLWQWQTMLYPMLVVLGGYSTRCACQQMKTTQAWTAETLGRFHVSAQALH